MGQCLGACFKTVPVAEYDAQVERIKRFLSGDTKVVKRRLTKEMDEAAENLEFERAADLRDQLKYIDETVESQRILSNDSTPRDIFNFYLDKGWITVSVLFIRQARLIRQSKQTFSVVSDGVDELTTYIQQFYLQKNIQKPKEILVPKNIDDDILSEALGVPVRTPVRGERRPCWIWRRRTLKLPSMSNSV